ncbi:disease resistance protein RPM1-like [Diospyros lotus]|uniref:disease resistance protein RPM1-like n=1 Tax=Diospyros lotus TaxID=55363 RepID=UPI0022579358|nr:disease resistance protein RPM1-like [Diospyros lotus]
MAYSAVNSVIQTLAPLIVNEARLLSNVRRDVASINAELESIKSFLKDADLRAETGDEIAMVWVKQVREVAYRIEDVIEEYMLDQGRRHCFNNLFRRVNIASQIQDIKQTIGEIKERADRYGFSVIQGLGSERIERMWHDPRVASLFVEEDELVGIESRRDELIGQLISEESKRVVISIVGMPGVGKTTLTSKVYGKQTVAGHFDCCAWIPISRSYKSEEILGTMLKQFYQCGLRKSTTPPEIDAMGQNSLVHKLKEFLTHNRYLIVFDDVWTSNFWEFIKHALPRNGKGSRVIITTRSEEVAVFCKESPWDHIHWLQPLPKEKAWELFCMKAFQRDFEGRCPPELKDVSLRIVQKCEGLPLAIVAISGILSIKNKIASEWKRFYDSLGSELQMKPALTSISKIVLLSYHDLPYYLRSCFLYFGIIPEDYSINCGRLIRLWIAEGFIEEQIGKTLEEVGEEYLIELIHRSLVQVSSKKPDGRVKNCRVHDVVREIIVKKLMELNFCHILGAENSSFNDITRRLSIHMDYNLDNVPKRVKRSRIRSILLFRVAKLPEKPLMSTLARNFKLLKTLDLNDSSLVQIHKEVGNLFHLRYLSVRHTKVTVIPKSIGKLHNLQTLDLKYSLVRELPSQINKLHKLRHLVAFNYDYGNFSLDSVKGVKMQGGIGCLKELQKLWLVEANHDAVNLFKELQNLQKLRKLGIHKLRTENCKDLFNNIQNMKHLKFLAVGAISEHEILDLDSVSAPPESLERLSLGGRLKKLPCWIAQLQNLQVLQLHSSGLVDDPLQGLQALPNLLMLTLVNVYYGEQLSFKVGSFPKLKRLNLRSLSGLCSMIIEEGALTLLEELTIGPCQQLQEVPSGIRYLRKLTTLLFLHMPTKFLNRMLPNKGQDHWIVEHIPTVKFGFWLQGLKYKVCASREFQNYKKRWVTAQKGTTTAKGGEVGGKRRDGAGQLAVADLEVKVMMAIEATCDGDEGANLQQSSLATEELEATMGATARLNAADHGR